MSTTNNNNNINNNNNNNNKTDHTGLGFFDPRFFTENKNLGYRQDMPTAAPRKKSETLDNDLRQYFGFGKRQFKTIVKKPGTKFGFRLSNYIHPTDSPFEVNNILSEIAAHIEYAKVSPVKEVFLAEFKKELRDKSFARAPNKHLIKLHLVFHLMYNIKKSIPGSKETNL